LGAIWVAGDLGCLGQRPLEHGLQIRLAADFATDIANAEPDAQATQFSMVSLELLGVSIAPGHHGRSFGDPQIRLPQPNAMPFGQAIESPDRDMQQTYFISGAVLKRVERDC
jgi:hypothetical protein